MLRVCLTLLAVLVLNLAQVMAAAHSGTVAATEAAGKGVALYVADPVSCSPQGDYEPEPGGCIWGGSILATLDPSAQPPAPARSLIRIGNPAFVAGNSGIVLPLDERPPKPRRL